MKYRPGHAGPEGDGWAHAFDIKFDADSDDERITCITAKRTLESFYDFNFTRDNWKKMGAAISQYRDLKCLGLDNCALNVEGIEALFGGTQTYHCPLEHLDLRGNRSKNRLYGSQDFGPDGVEALLSFLKSRSNLKSLDLNNTSLGDEGAKLIAEALNHVIIESLYIEGNHIKNDGVVCLCSAKKSIHLVEMYLDSFDMIITKPGIDAISELLQREDAKLKVLRLSCKNWQHAKIIIESISSESKLERLEGDVGTKGSNTTKNLTPILRNLVCNLSSFKSICQSNHRLWSIGYNTKKISKSDQPLQRAFEINSRSSHRASINERLRMKLRTFYFRGDFDVQPFIDMDIELMPYVLELVTKSDVCIDELSETSHKKWYQICSGNLNGIYRLVRNCHFPDMISSTLPEGTTKGLEAENAALKKEIDQLRRENNTLQTEADGLPSKRRRINATPTLESIESRNLALEARNNVLETDNAKMKARIERLEAQNKEQDSANSTLQKIEQLIKESKKD